MSPRIQFYLTAAELAHLSAEAQSAGYPNPASYCKALALKQTSSNDLWIELQEKIKNLEPGSEFQIRSLISNPPAHLGVFLYKAKDTLQIEKIGEDRQGTNVYIKLA